MRNRFIAQSGFFWVALFFPSTSTAQRRITTKAVCTDMIRTVSVTPLGQQHYSWLQTIN